ncbi:hypothetical protein BX616_010288 [Lobosporangium transversale]|uniref:F-box domain-containing protein n=1 Tax=Lobosporangium transversale TaxID=64571 RepID=A0A1Y2H358_9FUNG|nr:hypothetical protein BCR41DRAFT_344387 [Lobosporangium transversale]KAF9918079.1 hypothetical protein BX616_010288 [Lobosporangium transversale]ORZ28990.1 hypothetical protein BCR41DRAFT_344387 [Lobosporangium transversale]|eukprot:XP_021886663.1 hypothetical protein BCR41DRAFT_344387 [Lobosporangium transversale]
MVAPHPSIFDNSLIIATIVELLQPKDIWQCYRVSKLWSLIFGPHRFRDVMAYSLDSVQTSSILENTHRIRNLTIDLADARLLVHSSGCTLLKTLSCLNLGSLAWPPKDEATRRQWYQSYDPLWVRLDPSLNALSLVARNPGLQTLRIEHLIDRIYLQPFTDEVVKTLSVHTSLRRLSINMRMDIRALIAVLTHCPPNLEELEIWLDIYNKTDEEPSPMELSQPTALRRLFFHESLFEYDNIVLAPLLRQCPSLEMLKLPQLSSGAYGALLPVVINCCPMLHTFHHDLGYGVGVSSILPLVQCSSNNKLREMVLDCVGDYRGDLAITESTRTNPGALIEALLCRSTHTIVTLKFRGRMGHWTSGVVTVLEQCPNLKELEVQGDYVALSELVRRRSSGNNAEMSPEMVKDKDQSKSKQEVSSMERTMTTTTAVTIGSVTNATPSARVVLDSKSASVSTSASISTTHWACRNLESLTLWIDQPSLRAMDPVVTNGYMSSIFSVSQSQNQGQGLLFGSGIDMDISMSTGEARGDVRQTTFMQFGTLYQMLRAQLALKQLTLMWDKSVSQAIRTMLTDQGLPQQLTLEEIHWMGL